jgi:hypothetical protein
VWPRSPSIETGLIADSSKMIDSIECCDHPGPGLDRSVNLFWSDTVDDDTRVLESRDLHGKWAKLWELDLWQIGHDLAIITQCTPVWILSTWPGGSILATGA